MPNINEKIAEMRGGVPMYSRKINQLIESVNWLMAMRTDSGYISEGGRGPVIPVGGGQATAVQPWATDPDGNTAGWTLLTCLNLQTKQSFQVWVWTGQTAKNVLPIPWMWDPTNAQAGWIVCPSNTFWGTGQCSGGGGTCMNFQTANYVQSGNTSPLTITATPSNPPIVPPASCTPRFHVDIPQNAAYPNNPSLVLVNGLTSGQASTPFNWTYSITYAGTVVYTTSGSDVAVFNTQNILPFNPAGWTFDPSAIPGYTAGSGDWVFLFNGAASNLTNPSVVQTLTVSGGFLIAIGRPPVAFLTGS